MRGLWKKRILVPGGLTTLLGLSACFALPVEEPVLPPPMIATTQVRTYKTVDVTRGNVQRYRDMSPNYVPAREESLYFEVPNTYIKGIYVDVGDMVKKGDIVAELDREYYANELAKAAQDLVWAQLQITQLEERHQLDLQAAAITGQPVDDGVYTQERDALLAQLAQIRIRETHLRQEDERRVLRAGLDGTVTYAMTLLSSGELSKINERVLTIADQTQSVFMLSSAEPGYFNPGQAYEITINWETYPAVVVTPEELGIARASSSEVYLVLTTDDVPALNSATYATMRVVLEEVEDVLMIPYNAVKQANERLFVYVLEDGLRAIRDVEIGLRGTGFVEVISGLQEGEKIIIG